MDWGKVIFVFFVLMSLTTSVGFLYEPNGVMLFLAASINFISTILKIGVKNLLSAEMLASSLVADLHLIPAFFFLEFANSVHVAVALCIGAVVANVFSVALVITDSAKSRDDSY